MTEILNTVGSGSGYPILAAFAMFIAAWSLGRAIIKLLKLRADHLCAFVLGIDVIALLLLAMLSLFPGGRILAVTRGILAVLTIAALCYTKVPSFRPERDWKAWIVPGMFFLFLGSFFTAQAQAWDECVYQLALPLRWARLGALPVMTDLPYSGFPSLPQILYVPLLSDGGTLAVKLFYGICQAVFLAGLMRLTKGISRTGRILILLSFMTAPIILAGFRDIYAEVFIALNLTAGLLLLRNQKPFSAATFLLCGIFAGAMAAVKLTGCLSAFCLLAAWFLQIPAEKRKIFCMTVLPSAGLFALCFYLRPWIATGNPCYPYLCRYFAPAQGRMSDFHHALGLDRFGYDNPLKSLIYSFRDLSLPGREKLFDGSYGLTFLLFGLLFFYYLFLLVRKKKYKNIAVLYSLPALFYLVWLLTSPQARFLLILPVLTIFVFCHALRFLTKRQRTVFYLILIAGIGFNLHASGKILRSCTLNWKQLTIGTKQSELDLLYGRTGDDYLPACEWLKAVANNGKILLLFEERTLYLPAGTEIGTPLFQGKYFRDLNFTPEAVLKELQNHDIRTVYLRLPVNNPDLLPEMLKQYQPVRNAFFALAQQGYCTIKPISKDGMIVSFSKK